MEPKNETEAFLRTLGRYRRQLNRQTLLTLRGQALAGKLTEAQRGLDRMLRHGEKIRSLEPKDTC